MLFNPVKAVSLAVFIFLFLCTGARSNAQGAYGDAVQLSCNCYRLTEAVNDQGGFVWSNGKISLEDPFDYTFDVYLGDIPSGADGIAFVLQPIGTNVGNTGGGMGYEGISPSLAMSIDTYDNGAIHQDIPQDHVAIMANGSVDHGSADNLAGPEIALVSGLNIEDGAWHVMRVTWNPATMVLEFYMDGALRLTYTGDIITDIFGGDPLVYWGFTGSTGGLNNRQEFCFSIIPGLNADTDEVCAGEQVVFGDDSYSALGEVVAWQWEFGNGITSGQQHPGAIQFDTPGVFWVRQTIEDIEGCQASDSLQVTVNPLPVAQFAATEVCEGEEMDLIDQSTITSGSISLQNWDLGNGTTDVGPTVSVVYQQAGTYDVSLEVVSSQGCPDSVTATVTVFDNPTAQGSIQSTGLQAQFSTQLNSGEEAYWLILDTAYATEGSLNHMFADSGWYEVQLVVTNANGCMDTATYSIYIEGLPEFQIPNVFTPNDDQVNDLFRPVTYAVSEVSMRIFNRWGRPVFSYDGAVPQQAEWGWDGTVNGGAKASSGTYYYTLILKGVNGDNFQEKGTVTLIR